MPLSHSQDELWAGSACSVDNPGADTAASRTVTPDSGEIAWVDWFLPSWSAAPDVADFVTVSIAGVEKFRWRPGDVGTVQGPQISGPFYGAVGEVVLIAISAPSAATCSLAIKYRKNATIT